jgi:C4-dicarboxylate transporter DctM subunit
VVIFSIVVCAVLFAIGTPLYAAFGMGGLLIISLYAGFGIGELANLVFLSLDSFVLLAVPVFLLAGSLMVRGGISKPLISLFNSFTTRIPGGLGVATVVASAFVGSLTATSLATLAMVGWTMFPAMIEAKYDRGYSAGLLCSSCTLGNLIPPSLSFIVYGFLAGQSVAKLFLAGIVPGLVLTAALSANAVLIAWRKKFPLVPRVSWRERGRLFVKSLPALVLPVIILGGIYGGIFTPTEAGVVACVYCLFIGAFVYRGLNWETIWTCFTETAEMTGRILMLIACGVLIGKAFVLAQIPTAVTNLVVAADLSPMAFLLLFTAVLLGLGMIMEGNTILFITFPLIWPSVTKLGIDPIHLGVIYCLGGLIGGITPPVAVALYFTSSLFETAVETVLRGVLLFLGVLVLVLLAVVLFPELSVLLPNAVR